jgi:hypothetical protein
MSAQVLAMLPHHPRTQARASAPGPQRDNEIAKAIKTLNDTQKLILAQVQLIVKNTTPAPAAPAPTPAATPNG